MKRLSVIIPLALGKKFSADDNLKKIKDKIDLIIESGKNPSANRNKGIRKAKTEFVAFINSHSSISEDWFSQIIKFFDENPDIDIVGGPQITKPGRNTFKRASGYALGSIFGSGGVIGRYQPLKSKLYADEENLTSANLICRRKVLKKVMFDENLWPGEDPKFISDSKKEGFKIGYSANIVVYNERRGNISDFSRQIFNYGLSRAKKESILKTLRKPYFLVPSFFTLYLATFLILTLINYIFIVPLLLYFILNIYFSLTLCIKNKDFHAFFPLLLIFLTIHIVYGLGIIYGNLIKVRI